MSIIKHLRRFGAVLAGLGVAMTALAGAAHASTTMIPVPGYGGPGGGTASGPSPVIHTVVGGMPGWQIALIAVAAAIIAASMAVLLERTRSARRRLTAMPA